MILTIPKLIVGKLLDAAFGKPEPVRVHWVDTATGPGARAMSPYLEPPTIPEGMTVGEYRSSRLPRHMPLWKHVGWFMLHATANHGKVRIR